MRYSSALTPTRNAGFVARLATTSAGNADTTSATPTLTAMIVDRDADH